MTPFNPMQLASFETASKLAARLNDAGIGNGVLPISNDPKKSGIYIPEWEAGPGGFETPNGIGPNGERLFFLHYRFRNGFENVNVGLCSDRFTRYPASPDYVLKTFRDEIGS